MTQAQCATVASALISAGYSPTISVDSTGAYHIAVTPTSNVSAATVASFATTEGVSANVRQVDFS